MAVRRDDYGVGGMNMIFGGMHMIIGGMIMVFGGTIMTKRRDDYDFRRDELIPISEYGTPAPVLKKKPDIE